MNILYVCDKLTTFIINEIVELKKKKHCVYIISDHTDRRIYNAITKPLLEENGLLESTLFRFRDKQAFFQKGITVGKAFVYDLLNHPKKFLRSLILICKSYNRIKEALVDYLVYRQLFDAQIDIVHSPFSTPEIIDKVYNLSKMFMAAFTLAFRAHDIYENDNLQKSKSKKSIIKKASKVVTIAKYNVNTIEKVFDIHGRVEIVHSAVNIEVFKPKDLPKIDNSIISVCRLHEQKGIFYLLCACHILSQRDIQYRCQIIGEGPERKNYEQLIERYRIPNIHFVKYLKVEDIKKQLNLSSVFVLPCIVTPEKMRDVLPNALKEAMAMEVPVITTNICGIEELIVDGMNGILVQEKDAKSIAENIERLFNEEEIRNELGSNGRKKITKEFNIKVETDKLERIFSDAVAELISPKRKTI